MNNNEELFSLGKTVETLGAFVALEHSQESTTEFLKRHQSGDWGAVSDKAWEENDRALTEGKRLLSEYQTALGVRLWVITEADRSATTVLLPEEY